MSSTGEQRPCRMCLDLLSYIFWERHQIVSMFWKGLNFNFISSHRNRVNFRKEFSTSSSSQNQQCAPELAVLTEHAALKFHKIQTWTDWPMNWSGPLAKPRIPFCFSTSENPLNMPLFFGRATCRWHLNISRGTTSVC